MSASRALMKHTTNYACIVLLLSALTGTAAAAEWADANAPPPGKLDLRPPDITKLYTPEQLNVMLATGHRDNIAEIEVEASRARLPPPRSPEVWGGLAAPVWAVLHPLQAWRIFAPVPPDRAQLASRPQDFTSGYLEPAAVMPPSYGMMPTAH